MTKPLALFAAAAVLSISACSTGKTSAPAPSAVPDPTRALVSSAPPNGSVRSPAPPASGAGSSVAPGNASVAGATQSAVPAEKNPPGDIPDNLAYVAYQNAAGHYSFTHPEGWSQLTSGSSATFTDKLNGVFVSPGTGSTAPTVPDATQREVPTLTRTQPAFALRSVAAVTEPGGSGVLIVYRRNSAPDPVTGRQYRDEVQRYELFSNGRTVVMELFGPVGADNVDAYRTMVRSLRLH